MRLHVTLLRYAVRYADTALLLLLSYVDMLLISDAAMFRYAATPPFSCALPCRYAAATILRYAALRYAHRH